MSKLFQAGENLTTTENGALSFKSTFNSVLDLFFKVGASRGQDLTQDFNKAYVENPEYTIRLGLWARDVRGGAGERQHFRNFLKWITTKEDDIVISKIINKVAEVGRFDDLEAFWGTKYQSLAAQVWVDAIKAGNGLAAKWAPRKGKKGAGPLRKAAGLTEANWRKLVVSTSNTVEQKMCAQEWDEINYSHVPSVASARYQKAFGRNDPDGYAKFKEALESGDAKVNAGAIFPHDLVNSCRNGDDKVSSAQWDSLPDFLEGSDERFLPIIDTSASMTWDKIPGTSVYPIDVARGLGIYLAERNKSVFKNEFLEFNSTARAHKIEGKSLKAKLDSISRASVGGSTNLQAAIEWVLEVATRNKLPDSDLPTKLLIVSDMQFNSCSGTNLDAIEKKYKAAGYTMPGIIFWQVMHRPGSLPVTMHDKNTAIVSGYSPAVLRDLIKGQLDPVQSMLNVLSNDRYAI